MRAMKDSGIEWIDKIPAEWCIEKLGYHSEMIVPMRDKPRSFDGDIPWVRIEDFDGMYISKSKSDQNISMKLIDEMNIKIYPIGTVLCSCSCNLGQCAITAAEMCSNQTFIGVVAKEDINNRFLYYVLSSNEERLNYLAQGTIQCYLSQDDFCKLKIAICEYNEQVKIADYLDKKCAKIDALISTKKKTNDLLKEYRQSIIYEAVTKGIDPNASMKDSGIEWIGKISEKAQVIRLKYFAYMKGRIGWQGLRAEDFTDEGPFCVTGTDFVDGKVDWDSCYHVSEERYEMDKFIQLKNGDLLITKDGTIGKLAKINNLPGKACLNSHLLIIRPLKQKFTNDYLYYVLSSDIFWNYYKKASVGTIMESVSQETMGEFSFPIYSIENQTRIVEYLDKKCADIDFLIEANKIIINKLKEYRQSIIYEAVTGKVEIN